MQLKFDNKITSITHKFEDMSIMEAVCIIREQKGFDRANEANKIQFVTNLLIDNDVHFSIEKIAYLADVSEDFVQKIKNKLNK